jgi:PAS domain S-box-containing protein
MPSTLPRALLPGLPFIGLMVLWALGFALARRARRGALLAAGLAGIGALAALGMPSLRLVHLALLAGAAGVLLRWGPSGGHPRRWVRQTSALLALGPLLLGALALGDAAGNLPLLYGGQAPLLPPLGAAGMALLAAGQLFQAGWDTWPLALFRGATPRLDDPGPGPGSRRTLALFLALAALLLGGGTFFLRSSIQSTHQRTLEELDAVARLKLQLLDRWQEERLWEAERLGRSPLVQDLIEGYLTGGPHAPPEARVRAWMRAPLNRETRTVGLYDASGHLRLLVQVPGSEAFLPGPEADTRPWIQSALASERTLLQPLHQHRPSGVLHVGLWVPIGHPARGVLLLLTDPWPFMDPLLHAQVGLHPQAKTMLISADEPSGPLGPHDTLGAHGQPVVEAAYRVANSPWTLEVMGPRDEVYRGARLRARLFELALLGLCGLLALVLGLVLRQRNLAQAQAHLRLERERRSLADRYRSLMDQAGDMILLMDADGRIQDANAQAVAFLGHPLEALRGRPVWELRPPEDQTASRQWIQQLREGKPARFESTFLRADGTVFPVEVDARRVELGGEPMLLGFSRDITARKRQEAALLRLNRLYTALSLIGQTIGRARSRQMLFDRVCQALVEEGGFSLAWIGWEDPESRRVQVAARYGDEKHLLDRITVHTDDTPEGRGAVGTAIREGHPCILNDYLNDPASLPWRETLRDSNLAAIAAFPIRADAVKGALVVYAQETDFFGPDEAQLLEGAATDLAFALERMASQAALVESEARFRALSETMAAAVFIYQGDQFVFSNAAFERLSGYGPEDLARGLHIEHLVHPEDWPLVQERARARLAGGEVTSRYDFRIRTKDGLIRWVDFTAGRILWEGRPAGVGTATDITARREAEEARRILEEQLQQSQKLEALGSLAGGVAHDMNNVLGAILSLASTLQVQAGVDDGMARSLETIVQACTRGRGVVKSLLYFARRDLAEEGPVDLNALAREMGQLLSYTTLKRVHLEVDLARDLPRIRGDAGALSHTLLNLCVNACDAMPQGGTLHLRTERLPGGGVRVRVQDTGEGMSPEVLARCQEPFFTTKPKGQGTGLGLSMAHSTLRAHGGSLAMSSTPGQGTEAILEFPAERVVAAASLESPAPDAPPAQAALRILVVDDDNLIRESLLSVLDLLGHQATEAEGGAEALLRLEEGLAVDLVILDMNMPGMTGAQVLPRLLELRPEATVLLASGYSDEDIAYLVAQHPQVHSIQKPFSMKELDRKIRELPIIRAGG